MKQRPILFNQEMVKAVLVGKKTETRRTRGLLIINHQPNWWRYDSFEEKEDRYYFEALEIAGDQLEQYKEIKCPYGKIGDVLWVRETFAFTHGDFEPYDTYSYKADSFHRDINRPSIDFPEEEMCKEGWYDECMAGELKWKPSIYMPKAAARIFLEITEIRIERLMDITEESAKAEGVNKGRLIPFGAIGEKSYKEGFFYVWIGINGVKSLNLNPFVWIVKFKRIDA